MRARASWSKWTAPDQIRGWRRPDRRWALRWSPSSAVSSVATSGKLRSIVSSNMVGHLYPIWLKFRGGKGVATLLGVIAPLLWWPGPAVYALIWLGLLLIIRISSVAGLVAVATPPLVAVLLNKQEYFPLLLGFTLLVIWKHRANIQRLFAGTEPKIGRDKG